MDWDRNRRFDDHRGGESYRPGTSRAYSRRSRSPPRVRSPPNRLIADTWVPSTGRTYNRPRSRSPPPFRRRSRSPQPYNRDIGTNSYTKPYNSRRFSPRRDIRPRSPVLSTRRPRSPYTEDHGRQVGWSQGNSNQRHPRDTSPGRDYGYSRKERRLPSDVRYARASSPPRRMSSNEDDPRPTITSHARSPFYNGRRDIATDRYSGQRRRSQSPNDCITKRSSAVGSGPTSRRSSPVRERLSAAPGLGGNRSRSPPASQPGRRRSKDWGISSGHIGRTPSAKSNLKTPEAQSRSPTTEQALGKLPLKQDDHQPPRPPELQSRVSHTKTSYPSNAPSQPKAFSNHYNHRSPTTGTPHGPKTLPSHPRAANISLLSAPTRPRGGPLSKDTGWAGVPIRRATSSTAGSNITPTGPRNNQIPTPAAEAQRPRTYGHNTGAAASFFHTPKQSKYLLSLNTIIPGGKPLPAEIQSSTEKRILQLDTDKDRLFEQIAESQKRKRAGLRDWERLDRESSICALKSELAEGHLQCIADTKGTYGKALF
ncbi:hypothetical protein BJY04DRAFT_83422 [Aspergillus karnatakaensis]|uniref:uncharacterized protein n=1 Tax=Aspergillus karnatakaensis TaxID=1810916 RepID=UPI003CCE430A